MSNFVQLFSKTIEIFEAEKKIFTLHDIIWKFFHISKRNIFNCGDNFPIFCFKASFCIRSGKTEKSK